MADAPDIPPLAVHYQPVVDFRDGRVTSCEALIRFKRPDGTLVSPALDGLIDRIEADPASIERLMRLLLTEIAREGAPLLAAHPTLSIGVNVPPVVLGTGLVRTIMADVGLLPLAGRFVVEITERQALTPAGRDALSVARAMGVRVAVDDFGTGLSGLQQLMGLEFDVLKVDRSQVTPLLTDPLAGKLLRGLVALAGALRVRVTAEGVETREHALYLQAAGVDHGQGWYWSKAVPASQLGEIVQRGFADTLRWLTAPQPGASDIDGRHSRTGGNSPPGGRS